MPLPSSTIDVGKIDIRSFLFSLFLFLFLLSSYLLESRRVRQLLCRRRRDGERGQVGPVEHDDAAVLLLLPLHWKYFVK